LASGALTILFGSRETSDFGVDGLKQWWAQARESWGSVRRLVIYLDNGPNNSGTRTPFWKRMVEFADGSGQEWRLVYYPPYHSEYNPIERCWSSLEQKWGGSLLTSLAVILREARRMVWMGRHPTVGHLDGIDSEGGRLNKRQMKPIEARLQRSKTLPKYDITSRPSQPRCG
jgi:hypothetical protein